MLAVSSRAASDRQWLTPFVGGSYQFLDGAERLLDAKAMFFSRVREKMSQMRTYFHFHVSK
jgi:hypothetical protein